MKWIAKSLSLENDSGIKSEIEKLLINHWNQNKESLGPYHRDTLSAMSLLVDVYCSQDYYDSDSDKAYDLLNDHLDEK